MTTETSISWIDWNWKKTAALLGKNENIMMNRTLSFGSKLLVDDDEIINVLLMMTPYSSVLFQLWWLNITLDWNQEPEPDLIRQPCQIRTAGIRCNHRNKSGMMGMTQTWEPSLNCLKRWTTPETHQKTASPALLTVKKAAFGGKFLLLWIHACECLKTRHLQIILKRQWKLMKIGDAKASRKATPMSPHMSYLRPSTDPSSNFIFRVPRGPQVKISSPLLPTPKERESSPRMQVNAIGFIQTCSHSAVAIVGLCNHCSNGPALSMCFRLKILHFIWYGT